MIMITINTKCLKAVIFTWFHQSDLECEAVLIFQRKQLLFDVWPLCAIRLSIPRCLFVCCLLFVVFSSVYSVPAYMLPISHSIIPYTSTYWYQQLSAYLSSACCLCVSLYGVSMYVGMRVCVCVCVFMCVNMCVGVGVCVCMCICVSVCVCVCVCVCMCLYVQ